MIFQYYYKRMLNLKLMHINQNYEFPSQLHDSSLQQDHYSQYAPEPMPIRTENNYQVEQSISEQSQYQSNDAHESHRFEIDHELDSSSLDHDNFLEMIQDQNKLKVNQVNAPTAHSTIQSRQFLMVDRNSISLTLLQTQTAKQGVVFTNPTSSAIKMKINQCPFQIQSQKSLSYVIADQLQIIIEPWEKVELSFMIQPKSEQFGDIIEIAIITAEFVNRSQAISPVNIKFHIKFVVPKLRLKFDGNSEVVSMGETKMPITRLKCNKLGQYLLDIGLIEGIKKMDISIEIRGKAVTSTQTVTLYEGQFSKIKIRQRGSKTNNRQKQKCALILRPTLSKLCYIFGLQFLQ